MPENRIDPEDKYNRLLRTADDMEREGMITSTEWRKLAQQAGTLFARTADCMGESKLGLKPVLFDKNGSGKIPFLAGCYLSRSAENDSKQLIRLTAVG